MEIVRRVGLKKIIIYISLIVICLFIWVILIQGPSTIGDMADDFVGYWTAGRLLAFQENPYLHDNLIKIHQDLEFELSAPYPIFYPPPLLPLLIPIGLLAYPTSRFLWMLLSIFLVFFSGFWAWRVYDGPVRKRWVVILCILPFAPFYLSLIEGQITFLILFGLVGFLYFIKQSKWFLAGLFLTLLLIKFQLVYLILVAVLAWIIDKKQWRVLLGLISMTGLLSIISIILRPSIIGDYISFLIHGEPAPCGFSSLPALFCIFTGGSNQWLRYIPAILGILWGVFYYYRNRMDWIWKDKISLLIILSVMTAPLAWMHDQLLYIVPILEIGVLIMLDGIDRKDSWIIYLYLIINIIAIGLIPGFRYRQYIFIWMPIIYLVIYVYSKRNFALKY